MKKIFVWGLLYYLRFFAKLSLFINKPKIIGITGSVGKSSARNVIYSILKDHFKVKMIKEGNSETGIPLGILKLDPGNYLFLDWLRIVVMTPLRILILKNIEILIVEMGIDGPESPKNMDYLLTIVKPDISVVLNAYPVHSQQFDSEVPLDIDQEKRVELITKRIAEEKIKIISMAKPSVGIYNADNKHIEDQILAYASKSDYKATKLISFGKDISNDVSYGKYDIDFEKTCFEMIIPSFSSKKLNIELKGYFLPKKYQEIIASGILVGLSLGLKIEEIKSGLIKNFFLPKGRSSIFNGIKDSKIIDSSYNASRAPFLTFIETASLLAKKEKRPFIILMGDMRELGKEIEGEHEIIATAITKTADYFYCVGDLTKKYVLPEVSKKIKNTKWFENSKKLGEFLQTSLPYQSVVLVKGSQNTIFLEEAIKFILKNKEDEKKLCRQNDFWLSQKNEFFQGV